MVSLEWSRIINHALLAVKIQCDTVVLQKDLMSEISETLEVDEGKGLELNSQSF